MKNIKTVLNTKASKELDKQVLDDLDKPDLEPDEARAFLERVKDEDSRGNDRE